MPIGPKGQKRPADVIGNAVKVMRIATGEEAEEVEATKHTPQEAGRKGGVRRAENLPAPDRKKIAKHAARARWKKDQLA